MPTPSYDPLAAIRAADAATTGKMDPQSVVGAAAASQSIPEAVKNAQAMGAYGNTAKLSNALHSMTTIDQATAWKGFTASEQNQLHGIGYVVPTPKVLTHSGPGGGIFGDIWSHVASGFHTVVSAGEKVVSDALHALGTPMRVMQHVGRSVEYGMTERELASGTKASKALSETGFFGTIGESIGSFFGGLLDPASWAQNWRKTNHGTSTLMPAVTRTLTKKYGKTKLALGLRVLQAPPSSTGLLGQSVVAATPTIHQAAVRAEITSPAFRQMMTEIQNGRGSVGRMLVGEKFLNDHPTAGKDLSGALDATFDVASTPLNYLGMGVSAFREATYGMDAEEVAKAAAAAHGLSAGEVGQVAGADYGRMGEILQTKGVQRYLNMAGRYLGKGDYAGLGRFRPMFDNIAGQLERTGVDSAEKLETWFKTEAGMGAILRGQAGVRATTQAIIPHLSFIGAMKQPIKDFLENTVIRRLADGGIPDVALDAEDTVGSGTIADRIDNPRTLKDLLNPGNVLKQTYGHFPHPLKTLGGLRDIARMIRRMSTLVPDSDFIDLSEKQSINNVRRLAQQFLSSARTDDLLNIYVGADQGVKYRIIAGLRRQMYHAFGLYDTAKGANMMDAALAELEDMERRQMYSPLGLDGMVGADGDVERNAVLDSQLSARMYLPRAQDVRKLYRQSTVLGQLHMTPILGATSFMGLWRTMILERPGFAVRFSLTENINRLLRMGPVRFLGSYLANGAAYTKTDEQVAAEVDKLIEDGELDAVDRDAKMAAVKAHSIRRVMPYHPVERILGIMAQRVPEGIRPYVDSAEKFYGAVMGQMAFEYRQAERKVLGAMGMQDYIDAATHFYTNFGEAHDAFQDKVAATHGSDGFIYTPHTMAADTRHGYGSKSMGYREFGPTDPLWRDKYAYSLDQVAQSELGRSVLEAMDKTTRTQDRAVLKLLEDPDFADTKARFVRATRLPDGRVVGVDATQHEADLAWATTVRKHVNALVRSGDPERGDILHSLVDEMKETGRGPAKETLDAIPDEKIPKSVIGEDVLPKATDMNLLSKSFEVIVGKPANWLARQPHFIAAYAEALPSARAFAHAVMPENDGEAEKLAADIASDSAVNSMIPFVHNPSMRTQFEDRHRIMLPFLFAQRQFLMRWGRLMEDSPDAIRKIQLTMNGLRTSGFLTKNATGQTIFHYPGGEYVTGMITDILTKLGIKSYLPISVPFTGAVEYMMPGLSNPFTPSVGPFVAVPLKELSKIWPELNGPANTLLQEGATTPIWQEFTPTVFNRVWDAITSNQRDSELASTAMQAIKYLDSAGYGLSAKATAGQTEEYVRRVENWARTILVLKAALGAILPATPKATLDPAKLSTQWHTLITELGYTHGTARFVKDHPDATAYTVGESQIMTDGYTPATKASAEFLNAHIQLAQQYPLAAAWFIPRTGTTFTVSAYREQIALGVRRLRTVSSTSPSTPGFLQEVVMARAANTYYTHETAFNKAYTATTSSHDHQVLLNQWDNWKASFFKRNPVFARYKESDDAKIRRQTTIEQLTQAIAAGLAPDTPQTRQIHELLRNYNAYITQYTATNGLYSSADSRQRKALQQAMVAWGTNYAKTHPTIATFWQTVMLYTVQAPT